MRITILSLLATLALCASAAASPTWHDPCPQPRHATWHVIPSGCVKAKPGTTVILPTDATEVDVWSASGRVHLRQRRDFYVGDKGCPQYSFTARHGYAAGWVTCNDDVFVAGRKVLAVYYWTS